MRARDDWYAHGRDDGYDQGFTDAVGIMQALVEGKPTHRPSGAPESLYQAIGKTLDVVRELAQTEIVSDQDDDGEETLLDILERRVSELEMEREAAFERGFAAGAKFSAEHILAPIADDPSSRPPL